MRILFSTLFVLLVLIALAVLFLFSGFYNVAAVQPHSPFTRWLLATLRDQSVAKHSQIIQPPSLTDPQLAQAGFHEYHAMCFSCHNAPGDELSELAQGLNPPPPKLDADEVQVRSDAELYWIIQNGIRMTGMPAFGPTHKEETLWSIVAFLRRLPNLTPQEYKAMVEATSLQEGTGEHAHSHAPARRPNQEAEEEEHHHAHEHEH